MDENKKLVYNNIYLVRYKFTTKRFGTTFESI